MAKLNSCKQAPKGVRLRWTSLKEVSSVKLSSDDIHGTRSSSNGQFTENTDVRNRNNNSNNNFLIP